jgi:hypothetical protein
LYRFAGSIAFAAAARTVWQVTKEKEKPSYLFANTKMNIAAKAPTYRYSIVDFEGIGIPAWEGIVDVDAETAMNGSGRETPAQDEVLEVIRNKHPAATKFSDIVAATGKKKPNISNILKELETAGKIKKSDILSGYYSLVEKSVDSTFIDSHEAIGGSEPNEQIADKPIDEPEIW